MTDAGHTLAEITFTLIVDVILLGILYPFVKRWISKRFKQRDLEHGHSQPEPVEPAPPRINHFIPELCPFCQYKDTIVVLPEEQYGKVYHCTQCCARFQLLPNLVEKGGSIYP
jgi:Zn ribbon nucleic-acid-binding protein